MPRKVLSIFAAAGFAALFGGNAWACPASPTAPKFAAAALRANGAVAEARTVAASPDDATPSFRTIVGLWDTKFFDNTGALIDEGYEQFTSDGQGLIIDIAPPATDNVCNGVWIQTRPATYKLKHVAWYFDLSGNLLGKSFSTT